MKFEKPLGNHQVVVNILRNVILGWMDWDWEVKK
jgi:hypothetical protein